MHAQRNAMRFVERTQAALTACALLCELLSQLHLHLHAQPCLHEPIGIRVGIGHTSGGA